MNEFAADGLDLERVITRAKEVAIAYRKMTGKPLGITGEVAEYEAARRLELRLAEARQAGYDAVKRDGTKVQIKGRRIPEGAKRGQRVGGIRFDREWDTVVLVILDGDFEALSIYEASRDDIREALRRPGSIARNVRGALSVSQFKKIAAEAWSRQTADDQ